MTFTALHILIIILTKIQFGGPTLFILIVTQVQCLPQNICGFFQNIFQSAQIAVSNWQEYLVVGSSESGTATANYVGCIIIFSFSTKYSKYTSYTIIGNVFY